MNRISSSDFSHQSEFFENSNISVAEQLQIIQETGLNLKTNTMTDLQFQQLTALILHNLDLFATSVSDLVGTNLPKMHIETGNAKPVRTRNYPLKENLKSKLEPCSTRGSSKKVILLGTAAPWYGRASIR